MPVRFKTSQGPPNVYQQMNTAVSVIIILAAIAASCRGRDREMSPSRLDDGRGRARWRV